MEIALANVFQLEFEQYVCVFLSLDFLCEISLPMTSSTGHPCFPIVYECMKESRRRQFPGMQLGFQMKGQVSV
jgi:hypothetical protein